MSHCLFLYSIKNPNFYLSRLPATCKSLCSLSLSQNSNVNNTSVQKLLYLSAGDGACLEELTLRGCSICSPIGSELIEAFKTKMSCSTPLKKLVFSCKGLKPGDSSMVTGIWTSYWKEKGLVKSVGMSISLTVNSSWIFKVITFSCITCDNMCMNNFRVYFKLDVGI